MNTTPGQKYVDFIISFKGCGAELGNAMQIMTTAKLGKNLSGLKRFILETAVNAGGKPCPPTASASASAARWTLPPSSAARPSPPAGGTT